MRKAILSFLLALALTGSVAVTSAEARPWRAWGYYGYPAYRYPYYRSYYYGPGYGSYYYPSYYGYYYPGWRTYRWGW